MLLTSLFVTVFVCSVSGVFECLEPLQFRRFYKVRSCYRSKGSVVGARHYKNLTDCVKFAIQKGALAFNFSPVSDDDSFYDSEFAVSCQLLGCPEVGNNGSTLVKDENFDYYSVFGNLSATQNATCIKSTGLFVLQKDAKTYSESIDACQRIGGDLANVLSEARTTGLSTLIASNIQEWYKAAYIGLDDIQKEGVYETPLGTPIDCFRYRAWAPSHPRNKHRREDCGMLDNEKSWRIVNCKHKLPYICELFPQQSNKDAELMNKPNCTGITNTKDKRKCMENTRKYELLKNATRAEKCVLLEENWET